MSHNNYVCAPPPIESLSEESTAIYWPDEIVSNPNFSRQVAVQRCLLRQLQKVFALLPVQLTLAEGLAQGFIEENDAEKLCALLASQLESDAVPQRLSMYVPFELLSPITEGSSSVIEASSRLHDAYRQAWEAQLLLHEVRANYVDGDVLEPELLVGDHPRVVKAAHLIPGLLKVGHMTEDDVARYKRDARDPLLTASIYDACIVAADLGLLEYDNTLPVEHTTASGPLETSGMTKGRAKWLRMLEEAQAMQQKAEMIATRLESGVHVTGLLNEDELPIAIEAVRIASLEDEIIYLRHESWLKLLLDSKPDTQTRDALHKLYAHLFAIDMVERDVLLGLGFAVPDLQGPFYANREHLEPSVEDILTMCEKIATHPKLSTLVYPVALIFGSRVKGYGLTEADCDIAVFVKPGVERDERLFIERELKVIFCHERFDEVIKMFWLTKDNQKLRIIDWPDTVMSDAASGWMYVLFGALWFGEEEDIALLHQKLLISYLSAPSELKDGRPTYERWLEEMERDSLQYRLLHKGFERYHPVGSLMNTEHGSLIDGQSAFYDSKYRRIATELFVRRVFLPQI